MRFKKDGLTGNARPCFNCLKMMKDIGIHKIYYSTGCNEGIICEKIIDMISIQVAFVTRLFNCINNEYEIFFEKLIKNEFPKKIKRTNLKFFIEYNFVNIFPEYSYKIIGNKITFYNKNNQILLSSIII